MSLTIYSILHSYGLGLNCKEYGSRKVQAIICYATGRDLERIREKLKMIWDENYNDLRLISNGTCMEFRIRIGDQGYTDGKDLEKTELALLHGFF